MMNVQLITVTDGLLANISTSDPQQRDVSDISVRTL